MWPFKHTLQIKGMNVSPETIQVMTTFIKSVESRDPYTAGHAWRVSRYVVGLVKRLNWSSSQLVEAELGGLMHDLGKIKIPDHILKKPDKLSPEEYATIKEHSSIGAEIIRVSPSLSRLIPYLEAHHERFDGKGYPNGLVGEQIPLAGRLVAVADTFDAMTSTRPYRQALPAAIGLEELKRCQGTQFDPAVVALFLQAWEEGDFRNTVLFSGPGSPLLECAICGPIIEIPDFVENNQTASVQCPSCGGLYEMAYIDGQWTIHVSDLGAVKY